MFTCKKYFVAKFNQLYENELKTCIFDFYNGIMPTTDLCNLYI